MLTPLPIGKILSDVPVDSSPLPQGTGRAARCVSEDEVRGQRAVQESEDRKCRSSSRVTGRFFRMVECWVRQQRYAAESREQPPHAVVPFVHSTSPGPPL
jgi:hypothetical protein